MQLFNSIMRGTELGMKTEYSYTSSCVNTESVNTECADLCLVTRGQAAPRNSSRINHFLHDTRKKNISPQTLQTQTYFSTLASFSSLAPTRISTCKISGEKKKPPRKKKKKKPPSHRFKLPHPNSSNLPVPHFPLSTLQPTYMIQPTSTRSLASPRLGKHTQPQA